MAGSTVEAKERVTWGHRRVSRGTWSSVAALVLMASGCGSSNATTRGSPTVQPQAMATLTGLLESVGGPNGTHAPLSGQVTAKRNGGVYSASTDTVGHFRLQLPPGSYVVTGRSPAYQNGLAECRAAGSIIVKSGQTSSANVVCQLR